MTIYVNQGAIVRNLAKENVLAFMQSAPECAPNVGRGLKQAEIFRACGLDWGDYENASSSNQQYWLVAILRQLEEERKVERLYDKGPWRLRR